MTKIDWEKANKKGCGTGTSVQEITSKSREIVKKRGRTLAIPADEICDKDPRYANVTRVVGRLAKPAHTVTTTPKSANQGKREKINKFGLKIRKLKKLRAEHMKIVSDWKKREMVGGKRPSKQPCEVHVIIINNLNRKIDSKQAEMQRLLNSGK